MGGIGTTIFAKGATNRPRQGAGSHGSIAALWVVSAVTVPASDWANRSDPGVPLVGRPLAARGVSIAFEPRDTRRVTA